MRALIHVHHLLGTGHAVRAAAIGRALATRGVEVTLATGNTLPPTLDVRGLSVVALPPARAADTQFSGLVTPDGRPVDDAWRMRRRERVLALLAGARPDVLLTETFPFGRRSLAFELLPLVEAARARRILVAASVRDILVGKDDPAKERWMAETARAHYDLVLVHSDPAIVRLEASFPFAADVADLLRYTGYVHEPRADAPPPGVGVDEVVVSCGGGPVGTRLLEAALGARKLSRRARDATWRLLVGHGHDDGLLSGLAGRAGEGFVVEPARPDFPRLLAHARLSVSQAGYNTVLDVLAAGCPAVLVPFAEGKETEQTVRARLVAQAGHAVALPEVDLEPASLAAACDVALALGPAPLAVRTGGAAASAEILIGEAARRIAAA
jgi:predicted glycosyltransferase